MYGNNSIIHNSILETYQMFNSKLTNILCHNCINTMQQFKSNIKELYPKIGINISGILLRNRSQTQNNLCCMIFI